MDIGETTVTIGNYPNLGPMRIEIGQPSPTHAPAKKDSSSTDDLLGILITETRRTNLLLAQIHIHLTRPPWWKRLWERIKHVSFSR